MADLKFIPVNDIVENPVALRPVNRDSEEYIGLVDSIKAQGVLNAITVREVTDENGKTYFSLVDGLHRWNAAKDAGCETIPAQVISLNDAETLVAQVLANVHKVETRPVEYSRQLGRILTNDPLMTITELASKLSKSTAWVSERLGLIKLDKGIAALVDEGKIGLSNAYALAKLPPEEQKNFVDRAMTQTPAEFVPAVNQRVKEVKDAKKQGKEAGDQFTAVPHLQKLKAIKDEFERATVGPMLVRELGIKTPEEAFALAIKWALHMDTRSVEVAKAKDEERRRQLDDQKKKREADRAKKKAEEAAEKAAKLAEAVNS